MASHLKRGEVYSRLLVLAVALAAIGVPFVLSRRTPLMHARLAENGGWTPEVLKATVGEPLQLHLTSDDVVHGFAVGRLNMQSVDILPGKVSDVTLLFDRPGSYTFYCTRWCGLNHWRMRGTIEVSGGQADAAPVAPPLYVLLGLDLDAPRNAANLPAQKLATGIVPKQFATDLSAYQSSDYYRAHSPSAAWQDLRHDAAFSVLSDAELWNLTAAIWQANTTPQALADGGQLFAQNCAACHGEQGRGDGVFADDLAATGASSAQGMSGGNMAMQTPADLTNPARMLAASPALLQGKILRGGMGTGMPSWGPIFTDLQTWNLVAFLYTFQFKYR